VAFAGPKLCFGFCRLTQLSYTGNFCFRACHPWLNTTAFPDAGHVILTWRSPGRSCASAFADSPKELSLIHWDADYSHM